MKLTSFIATLATCATLLATNCLQGAEEIFVGGLYGPIGTYNTNGTPINENFIPLSLGSQPSGMALSGNELFVVDDNLSRVGVYNATTGAAINENLITVQSPVAIAASGSTLFITTNNFTTGQAKVSTYTTSGALVNSSLISGLSNAEGLVIVGDDLYVSDADNGTVGKYTTSGTVIDANLITGLSGPQGLASDGSNLYVAEVNPPTIAEYSFTGSAITSWFPVNETYALAFLGSDLLGTEPNGTSVSEYTSNGQLVNANFISDSNNPFSIIVGTPGGTPTPTPTPTPAPTVTPTPPPHGGLSATVFYVDGSETPVSGVADTIINFSALQTGTPAGLYVRVQYSISGGTWTDLNNGDAGQMIYDPTTKEFVTASTNYPPMSSVSFRAISAAQGYSDSISNVVGPFNLSSSKPRLSPPVLSFTGNGTFSDLYFRSYVANPLSNITLRVQRTTTPLNQGSWADLDDGVSGHLIKSNDPTRYFLMDNQIGGGNGVYFRVIESLTGYEDSISTPVGPFNITSDTPPTVTITAPKALSGNGSVSSPYLYNAGDLTFTAKSTPGKGRKVEGTLLYEDGLLFGVGLNTSATGDYTFPVGDHLIEATAIDDLKAVSRFGANPIYIRVIPGTSSQEEAEMQSGGHSKANASISGTVYTQVKDDGEWTDATTWKSSQGKNGVPGPNDIAILNDIVYLPTNVTVGSVTLGPSTSSNGGQIVGGTLFGGKVTTLTLNGTLSNQGDPKNSAPMTDIHLIVSPGASCNLWNTKAVLVFKNCIIDNYGDFYIHGSAGITGATSFNNSGSINFEPPLSVPVDAGLDPTLDTRLMIATSINSAGQVYSELTSQLIGQDGSGVVSNDGGSIVAAGGGNIVAAGGGNIVAAGGGNIVAGGGGNLLPQTGGAVVNTNGSNFTPPGGSDPFRSDAAENATPSGFVQNGGDIDLDGILIEGNLTMNGGVLSGTGNIVGNLINNGGYISPGHSAGAIGVSGFFTQTANGSLVIEDGGAMGTEVDQLQVAGKATLGGTLELQLINGYKPSTKDTFSPLGYASATGKFASVSANGTVSVGPTGITSTVNSALAGPAPAASRNISTRADIESGDNVAIGGFIVTGPAGSTKKVILRGIGPSLTGQGVQGALADPVLQLYKGSTLLSSNDNWTTDKAAVEATGVAPTNPLESAIVATLEPGAYTAILSGKDSGTGVGLVEVYDLAPDSAALLANISTRSLVQTEDNVMIGGFILQGPEPATVLVRAIGPSLAEEKIANVLADPVLDLYDANGAVISNDDWRNTQEAEIIATGVPPTNNKESAIVATLPPGPYTAIVSGKNGGTGVALVEVYNLQ